MISQDKTEAALLAEFGSYVSAVAQGFSKPLQASLEEAERKMLVRIGEQRDTAERADKSAKIAVAALNASVQTEVAEFANQVRSLQSTVAEIKIDLASSVDKFHVDTAAQLQTAVDAMEHVSSQLDLLSAIARRNKQILYVLVTSGVTAAVILAMAYLRVHPL